MPGTPDDAAPGPAGSDDAELSAEDAKLLTLARSARARTGGSEGAAVRDDIGRTYAAATVDLPSLRLTAVQAAVAAAVSSGSDRLEAVAVVGVTGDLGDADRAVLADLSVHTVLVAGADGVA
jgi:hypothetical protein